MRRGTRPLVVVAGVLVLLGGLVVATAPSQSFGWFAYAPLSNEVYVAPALPLVLGGRQLLGLGAVVVGLVVGGVAVGLRLGSRQR